MQQFDLSKNNPFASYTSDFGRYFSFGAEFDKWVCDTILGAALPIDAEKTHPYQLADIGAGSCYWSRLFLEQYKELQITAVDPSSPLILEQASVDIGNNEDLQKRLTRHCMTAQDFSNCEPQNDISTSYDCIYFMQSAHYVGDEEFRSVFSNLAKRLKKDTGKIVIQARNMTAEWYPWAFPFEWTEQVEKALRATAMFGRANSYKRKFKNMDDIFRKVTLHERHYNVRVDCESYWERLENRWIPTFMSEEIIPPALHRAGIDSMKKRFADKNETLIGWRDKYALVTAYI
ncbi:MAG: class I SAM-dependent methyltransferase [Sneathiella sp.]